MRRSVIAALVREWLDFAGINGIGEIGLSSWAGLVDAASPFSIDVNWSGLLSCDSNRSMKIYIHRPDKQYGPYSLEEARDYMASGSLLAHDLAWKEGSMGWMPLAQLVAAEMPRVESAKPPKPTWIPPRRDASFE